MPRGVADLSHTAQSGEGLAIYQNKELLVKRTDTYSNERYVGSSETGLNIKAAADMKSINFYDTIENAVNAAEGI